MVIAGRADDRIYEAELRRIALRPEYQGALEFATDLTLDELEQEMARCDLAIQLRWPTAGEMSATLMRTFGAGRPAAVTDVPQFGDLDPAFCWKVPHDFDLEVDALLDVMRRAAADPVAAWDAGQKAREFVAAEATYEQVARDYVTHITECAELQRQRPMTSQRLNIEMRPGFNVVSARNGRAETIEAADALAAVIRDAGIDAVRVELDVPYRPTEPPSQRPRPVEKPEWPPPTRLATNSSAGSATTRSMNAGVGTPSLHTLHPKPCRSPMR
jgi:hypothetical protein